MRRVFFSVESEPVEAEIMAPFHPLILLWIVASVVAGNVEASVRAERYGSGDPRLRDKATEEIHARGVESSSYCRKVEYFTTDMYGMDWVTIEEECFSREDEDRDRDLVIKQMP